MAPARIPAEVFPPGEFIRDELEARGWKQEDLAKIMGRPLQAINELIGGKKQITPETALGLAKAFGDDDALYWLNLDNVYRLSKAKPVDHAVEHRARVYAKFPVRDLIKRKWIADSDNPRVIEHRVCQFFQISSIDDTPQLPHAAKANQYNQRDYEEGTKLQYAWLFRAKALASCVQSAPYNEGKLKNALTRLHALMIAPEEIRQIPSILAEAGVRFVIVEFLKGAKIDGATFWLDDTTPVIAMSLRFDRINNFWFVLRHEIEHVLRRDGTVIDVELTESLKNKVTVPLYEQRANDAAADYMVPRSELQDFITQVRPLFSERRISLFAKKIGVHPGIVVGQLQHHNEVPYTHFHKLLVKVREIITKTAITDGWGLVPSVDGEIGA
ncbi:MAG TPA: helix-turn-helix domain-containing protein [Pseudolabrys sp.]|nr:helix-turn-helix domain-containing protein [Pseudolabrys sp.]